MDFSPVSLFTKSGWAPRPGLDVIFFTGGSHLGKMVAASAARHLTPTLLELGGQAQGPVPLPFDSITLSRRTKRGHPSIGSLSL